MDFTKLKNINLNRFRTAKAVKKKPKVRLYDSCDNLILHNFNRIKEGKFEYLIWGYDGFSEVELPENYMEVWKNILEEYELKTQNSELTSYYELIVEIGRMELRYETALSLLNQIDIRPNMEPETLEAYKEELRYWRFYFDAKLSLTENLKIKKRQLGAIQMKINLKKKDRQKIEGKHKKDTNSFEATKQLIFLNTDRLIDEHKITVTGWIEFLNALSKKKAVA